jgi:hypothetical protein
MKVPVIDVNGRNEELGTHRFLRSATDRSNADQTSRHTNCTVPRDRAQGRAPAKARRCATTTERLTAADQSPLRPRSQ